MATFIRRTNDFFISLAGKFQTGTGASSCPCKCGSNAHILVTLSWTDSDTVKNWMGLCWHNGESRALCGTYYYNHNAVVTESNTHGTTGYMTGIWKTSVTESFVASGTAGTFKTKSKVKLRNIYKPLASPAAFGGTHNTSGSFSFDGFGKHYNQNGKHHITIPSTSTAIPTVCTASCSSVAGSNDTFTWNPTSFPVVFGTPSCATPTCATFIGNSAGPDPFLNDTSMTTDTGITVSWSLIGGRT